MVSLHDMRRDARAAFEAAIAAVQPANLVPVQVRRSDGRVVVAGEALPEVAGRRVVMAIGKAAPGLAAAWLEAVPGWTHELFVLTPHGVEVPRALQERAAVLRGAHPYPDAEGEASARRLLEAASSLDEDDLLLVLLSGGGSALMATPESGLRLGHVRATTEALLKAGAAIGEVNTVRRELLAAAGGGLARAASPARVRALILSDVIGDPLSDIASGPTVPSPTGPREALAVLDRFGLGAAVPAEIIEHLENRETDTEADREWEATTSTLVIGNNRTAVDAAAAELRERGWSVEVAAEPLSGEASERGCELAAAAGAAPPDHSRAVVCGGETTVTVRGEGRGGRSQELALAAAIRLAGGDGVVLLAAGTDGVDGQSENAGAVVDGGTVARIRKAGHDPDVALRDNDSATALEAAGDAIRVGATGTNVCDLALLLTAPQPDH